MNKQWEKEGGSQVGEESEEEKGGGGTQRGI